jgi:hypothetical protein
MQEMKQKIYFVPKSEISLPERPSEVWYVEPGVAEEMFGLGSIPKSGFDVPSDRHFDLGMARDRDSPLWPASWTYKGSKLTLEMHSKETILCAFYAKVDTTTECTHPGPYHLSTDGLTVLKPHPQAKTEFARTQGELILRIEPRSKHLGPILVTALNQKEIW